MLRVPHTYYHTHIQWAHIRCDFQRRGKGHSARSGVVLVCAGAHPVNFPKHDKQETAPQKFFNKTSFRSSRKPLRHLMNEWEKRDSGTNTDKKLFQVPLKIIAALVFHLLHWNERTSTYMVQREKKSFIISTSSCQVRFDCGQTSQQNRQKCWCTEVEPDVDRAGRRVLHNQEVQHIAVAEYSYRIVLNPLHGAYASDDQKSLPSSSAVTFVGPQEIVQVRDGK